MVKNVFIMISMMFFSCGSVKSIKNNNADKIIAIKFMGTIHTFPSTLDEKSFWGYKDEHVKLIINQDNFIGEIIKNIGTENYKNLNDIKYAFLVTNSSTIDTLYSDEDLKDWTLKRKGKDYHYYDEEGKLAKSLRQTYSFFSDCW